MLGGRLLAINEGFGYRPILTVTSIVFSPQQDARRPSTFVYGNQVMTLADNPELYVKFLKERFQMSSVWDQLRILSDDSEEQIYALFPRYPVKVVLEQELVMLAAGKDPLKGYWVQFDGSIELFSQPYWWKEREEYEE